jgi:hypothetical protein
MQSSTAVARRPREVLVRSGSDLVMLFMFGGGIFFTALSVVAWIGGRRLGSLLLAVVAGANFAFAAALLADVTAR